MSTRLRVASMISKPSVGKSCRYLLVWHSSFEYELSSLTRRRLNVVRTQNLSNVKRNVMERCRRPLLACRNRCAAYALDNSAFSEMAALSVNTTVCCRTQALSFVHVHLVEHIQLSHSTCVTAAFASACSLRTNSVRVSCCPCRSCSARNGSVSTWPGPSRWLAHRRRARPRAARCASLSAGSIRRSPPCSSLPSRARQRTCPTTSNLPASGPSPASADPPCELWYANRTGSARRCSPASPAPRSASRSVASSSSGLLLVVPVRRPCLPLSAPCHYWSSAPGQRTTILTQGGSVPQPSGARSTQQRPHTQCSTRRDSIFLPVRGPAAS